MMRNYHRWEVDPLFKAAEEVQDSADRLEVVYQTWVHAKSIDLGANGSVGLEHHSRELSTALGTAKWQLEEFERAVSSLDTDVQGATSDDAPARHKQFVDALQNQINLIERSLLYSGDCRDLKALPGVQLGQEEKDDLALFLSGSKAKPPEDCKKSVLSSSSTRSGGKNDEESTSESVKSSNEVSECFSTSASNSENTLGGLEISARAGNGHSQSGSSGSGFKTWKSSSADDEGLKKGPINNSTCSLKFWSPFFKTLSAFDRRLSKSGLKRWKDGDLNSMDHSLMLKLRHKPTDLEMGNEIPSDGGILNYLNGYASGSLSNNRLVSKHWSEASKTLQSFIFTFSGRRSVPKASLFLVASGFAALVFFRMILPAL